MKDELTRREMLLGAGALLAMPSWSAWGSSAVTAPS